MTTTHPPVPRAAGWYGKLPSRGDFVGQGLPHGWLRQWDDWLARALALAARQAGPAWRERLLAMPPWQCVVLPEHAGAPAWSGVVAPSNDRVGRAFPVLLAEAYELDALEAADLPGWQARGRQLAQWLGAAVAVCTPREFDAGLAQLTATPWPCEAPLPAGPTLRSLRQQWPAARSWWWRADALGATALPLAESWPPRDSLLLDWLPSTPHASGGSSGAAPSLDCAS